MKMRRLLSEWAGLFALSILGAVALQSSGITQRIDNQLLDKLAPLARAPMPNDIALIVIDDRSLAEIGAWPWPRRHHAQLLDRLDAAEARVVVLDVLFLEPGSRKDDAALESAMQKAGNVLLPHTFTARTNSVAGIDPLYPLPQFVAAAAGTGHVVAEPDGDGILRRFDLVFATDKGEFEHLALKALAQMGDSAEGRTERKSALIPFHSEGSIAKHSASDVISGAVLPEFFAGKTVLIGATAQGLGDRYSVAAGDVTLMTGVETQANLLSALMTNSAIDPLDALWQNTLATVALIALFASFWYLAPRYGLYAALVLIVMLLAISAALLVWARIWLPAAPAIIMIVLAYPLWSWRRLGHVSRYLDSEALRMMGSSAAPEGHRGMEYLARQVQRISGLIHAVEDSLAHIRQVIEAAPDAMIVLDDQGRVQMLNERAEQLFPSWQSQGEQTLAELFLFARASVHNEGSELTTDDGRTFLIARSHLDAGSPQPSERGLARGASAQNILALREISELRRLDQERGQMLEFLSHDMRTPQVAIIGLARRSAGMRESHDTMERIRTQAERTLKLADDFVQLARLEVSQLHFEDSDIGALIEEACDRAYVLAAAKRIRIEQHLPAEPRFADVDASLIARMLDNLIGNAVKYSPENTVVDVSLGASNRGDLQISVADQGAGLPEVRIKDPFARFGAHSSDAGPSAGLGLALVKKVVDAHGGMIEVASRKGAGTRFTINLRS
ncbi:CHASE2 domain-containing protein [Qipengyuania sp. ASV99]|uniref:CHASE2 domain-containing protein n=1 Tax=Qipengyuania sp. ASV99 TaxID=3399681 RepID=UPI003A4C80F1